MNCVLGKKATQDARAGKQNLILSTEEKGCKSGLVWSGPLKKSVEASDTLPPVTTTLITDFMQLEQ
jgi:hypothetical protein